MSSFALRATVLISLDAHTGCWCTLRWLVGRIVGPMHKVMAECETLAQAGQIQAVTRADGMRCYGVRVSPESPLVDQVTP